MAVTEDPAILRRRLVRELKRLRSEANLTQASVAKAMDWSPSKVIRIETGAVAVATNDLKVLLDFYGVRDPEGVERILRISRDSKKPSPWAEYLERGAISLESATYFGQESSAQIIRQFEPLLLPGLLQTEEYMRAVLETTGRSDDQVDDAVEARLKRQEIFDDPKNMPEAFFIIDGSSLLRQVGGVVAMRRQLARLEELAALDQVTIQVVPLSIGAYPGLFGPFTLLEFTDDDPVLYLESQSEVVTREDSANIGEYLDSFQKMEKHTASKPDEIGALIREIAT